MHCRTLLPIVLSACLGPAALAAAEGSGGLVTPEDLITIETSEKPLDVVLQWISRRAGINIVSNETELPKVTIRLVNVTWQEAIDQIARRYGFVIEKRSERIWELTKPPKVRLDLQNAQLPLVLESLARQAGVNIVISDAVDVNRRLTMTLDGVPWREALDVIVKTTGFVWIEQDYNIIRVVHPDDVQKDLQTRVYRLNYTPGETAQKIIEESALSDDGQVSYDNRTSSLIITDTPVSLAAAFTILDEVDIRTEQVQIEMKFVEFNTTDALNFGFGGTLAMQIENFGFLEQSFFPFTTSAGRFFSEDAGAPGPIGSFQPPGSEPPGLPGSTRLWTGQLTFEAVSTFSSTEVIQSPTLLTLNNEEAEIAVTQEIRFAESVTETTESGNPVRTLQEAESSPVEDGIKIKVTPYITSDGFVTMELETSDKTNEFLTFTVGQDSIDLPQLRNKAVKTNIMVADGDTAVIGGILQNRVTEEENKIPLLGDIPVLGWLFKSKNDVVEQRNLTIFITPNIVEMTEEDELHEQKLLLREQLSGLELREPKEEVDGTLSE